MDTPAQRDTAEGEVALLLERGYVSVPEFGPLHVGQRVCNSGERRSAAEQKGSAVIEHIFHRKNRAYEKEWGRPDVEVVVKRDTPTSEGAFVVWSDHRVIVARDQPNPGPVDGLTTH